VIWSFGGDKLITGGDFELGLGYFLHQDLLSLYVACARISIIRGKDAFQYCDTSAKPRSR
jgi:hypothetical protein